MYSNCSTLILGERVNANWIAEELQAFGFNTVFQKSFGFNSLPPFSEPNSLKKFRELFAAYANFCKKNQFQGLIHPGTTLWAERPELSTIAQEYALTVISPPSLVLSLFNHKLNFLLEAERIGIQNGIINTSPMYSRREVEKLILEEQVSFPFILRAVKGGGAFSSFLVQNSETLGVEFSHWMDQLRYTLGEVVFFAEQGYEASKRITAPFARFKKGEVRVFPLIDASLQSGHRKLIEFCPAYSIGSEMTHLIQTWVRKLADHFEYIGVGFFEFLVIDSKVHLLEGGARLNTTFRLWERIAQTNAIAWQLAALNSSKKFIDLPISEKGWKGLSLRLYAEDPFSQLPQPGFVNEIPKKNLFIQQGVKCELSFGYDEGEVVDIADSGLLGILILQNSGAADECISSGYDILSKIWIAGSLQTNERLLLELLKHPWLRSGFFHSYFIDQEFIPCTQPPSYFLEICIKLCKLLMGVEQRGELSSNWIVSERWLMAEKRFLNDLNGDELIWLKNPKFLDFEGRQGLSGILIGINGEKIRTFVFPISFSTWLVRLDSWFLLTRNFSGHHKIHNSIKNFNLTKKHYFLSQLNGKVHSILHLSGAQVSAHEPLIVINSLNRLIPHSVPTPIRICQWKIKVEDTVELGQELADIEVLV